MTVTVTTTRNSFAGNGTIGPHSIGFTILDATHIQVYWDKGSSSPGTPTGLSASGYLTKDTHYTVQNAGTSSNATITYIATGWTVSSTVTYPPSGDTIVVTRNVALTQGSDYTNNSTIDAETIENSFDKLTQITQQLDDGKDYSIKFASNLAGSTGFDSTADTAGTITQNKSDRISKILAFDANGDISVTQELGTYRGNWATGQNYVLRDLVKQSSASDTSTQNNVYICTTAHASTGLYLTQNDTSNWTLVLEVAAAQASADTATTQATKAGRHEDNAEAYAQTTAETLVTYTNPTSGATSNDGYSSLHYREKAKEWAGTGTGYALVTDDTGANTTEYSAKAWAAKPSGTVDGATASAKVSAANAATSASNASDSESNASVSAIAAAASAASVASVFDSFDDKFLGTMADNAAATTATLTGASASKDSSSITFTGSSGTITVGQELTSTGTGYPSSANIIGTSTTSPITISAPFTAAISSASLTFTGQGVYGAWDASKDGPSTDNDGNALLNGALYYNSTDGEMRVYDTSSGAWIAASAAQNATVLDFTYTLSGSDATISGSDDNSATLSFSNQESVDVFLNGVKLVPKIGATANDYHLDTANTVTLTSTAVSGDVILVRVYKTFTVGDAVPASTGGTFSGNVAVTGDLTVDTDTLKVDATGNKVGIGATSGLLGKLHIQEFGSVAGSVSNGADTLVLQNNGGHGGLSILTNNTGTVSIHLGDTDSSTRGGLQYENNTSNERLDILSGGSVRTSIDSSGNVTVSSGNLVIGTAGKGIDFSNQTAGSGMELELLDHYEEGEYQVTSLSTGGGTVPISGGYDMLSYVRIGSMVHVGGELIVSGTLSSGGDGALRIPLPFAVKNKTDSAESFNGSLALFYVNIDGGTNGLTTRVVGGSTYATMLCTRDQNSYVSITGGNIASNSRLTFSIHYITSA